MRKVPFRSSAIIVIAALLAPAASNSSDPAPSPNRPPTSGGRYAFSSVNDTRASIVELSGGLPVGDRCVVPTVRDDRLLHPDAGEKSNRPGEQVERQFTTSPIYSRTVLPDAVRNRADRVDRQTGR